MLMADVTYRAIVPTMQNVSDSAAEAPPRDLDPEFERQQCSECGELIAAGMGRYNVGTKRYHVECYDAARHMVDPQAVPPRTE